MHHNDLYDSVKTANQVLELNAKMLLANQNAELLNFKACVRYFLSVFLFFYQMTALQKL